MAEIKPEDTDKRGVKHDLLLGAIILFNLLTGYAIRYSIRGLKERFEPLLKRYRSSISWGTQGVLRKSLHRNPIRRYQHAKDVVTELRMLTDYWSKSDQDLYKLVQRLLGEAYKQEDLYSAKAKEYASRAKVSLEIIKTRDQNFNQQKIDKSQEQIDGVLSKMDFLAIGMDLFYGSSWQEAYKKFEEGKDWSSETAIYRRWSYLMMAMMGNKVPRDKMDDMRDRAKEAIQVMESGNWEVAKSRWNILSELLNPQGIEALISDCELFSNWEQAEKAERNDQFRIAAQNYRNAMDAMKKLPDRDFVEQIEVGDLSRKAEEMELMQRTRGKARESIANWQQLPQEKKLAEMVRVFTDVIETDPELPELAKEMQKALSEALGQGLLSDALQMIDHALRIPAVFKEIGEFADVAGYFHEAERDKYQDVFFTNIKILCTQHGDQSYVIEFVKRMLDDAIQYAMARNNLTLMDQLQKILIEVGETERAEEIRMQANLIQDDQYSTFQTTVDRELTWSTHVISLVDMILTETITKQIPLLEINQMYSQRAESLQKAKRKLDDAARIGKQIGYRVSEIEELQKRLKKQIESLETTQINGYGHHQQRGKDIKDDLLNRWDSYQHLAQWRSSADVDVVSGNIQESLSQETYSKFKDIYILAHQYLSNIDHADEQVANILREITAQVEKCGLAVWKKIASTAEQHINEIQREFEEVERLFEKGDLTTAQTGFDRIANLYPYAERLYSLKDRIISSKEFENWYRVHGSTLEGAELDIDILKNIHKFAKKDIPKVYWDRSRINDYLTNVNKHLKRQFERALQMQAWKDASFTLLLSNLINIERTIYFLAGKQLR